MTTAIVITVFLVGVAAGAYGWYRFGPRVKADAQQIRQMKL